VPTLATPDAELLTLLRRLAERDGAQVHIVSGRPMAFLEQHLGALPIGLHGEHGLISRPGKGLALRQNREVANGWKKQLLPLLEEFVDRTPGSFVEEKGASLAWHYRKAEPVFAAAQAHELQLHVAGVFSNAPVQLLCGDKVLEVRAAGVHKGLVVGATLSQLPADVQVLAMGDDTTDEDLFAALPPGAAAIHVGPKESIAPVRLRDVAEARRFLQTLLG
jgi:trehalose 6-phosphate synthase/phosphatase